VACAGASRGTAGGLTNIAAHLPIKAPAHKASAHNNCTAKAPAAQPQAQAKQLPPRTPFTAADEVAAAIPDMPDARFWADSVADFTAALPPQPGPWLALSSGGADGAFGAGLLNGLSESGKRPDYAVVTGVSTGALMAPFVFAGRVTMTHCAPPIPKSRRPTFSRSAPPARVLSIPGRSRI